MAPAVPTSGQSVQKSGEPESKTAPRQGLKLHHGRELFQQITALQRDYEKLWGPLSDLLKKLSAVVEL